MADKQKTLASRRGSLRVRWSGRSLAPVPPRPSVLPPGAGNKPKKAIKPQKRAKQRDEGYVGEPVRLDRHMDAAAIRRDDDGDAAAVLSIEAAQVGLRRANAARGYRAVRAV